MFIDTQKRVLPYRAGLWMLVSLLWLASVTITQAQQDGDLETYTWLQEGLTIDYPQEWVVDVDAAYFGVTNGELRIDFYPSDFLPTPPSSMRDILSLMVRNMRTRGEIPTGDTPQALTVGGFAAERLNYASDAFDGFYLAVATPNNQFWLVDAYRQRRPMDGIAEQTVLEIIDTMRFLPSAQLFDEGSLSLQNYAATPELILRELEQARIIEPDGFMIFQEAFLLGELMPGGLVDDQFGSDVVMGALVAFDRTPESGDTALCALIGRASDNSLRNGEGTFLLVALRDEAGTGSILFEEFNEADEDRGRQIVYRSGIDTRETIHLMVIVQNGEVAVFVNGQQLDDPQPLLVTTNNQRSWAGFALSPGCVMSNVWAYDLP